MNKSRRSREKKTTVSRHATVGGDVLVDEEETAHDQMTPLENIRNPSMVGVKLGVTIPLAAKFSFMRVDVEMTGYCRPSSKARDKMYSRLAKQVAKKLKRELKVTNNKLGNLHV